MISSISSNLSALNAFGKKLGVTANNIANVESEGYKKNRAVIVEGKNKDVEVEITKVETPGPIVNDVVDDQIVQKELSNVDLTEEIPSTIISRRGYEANLKAIEIQEETLGSIMDIIG
jgi:flagellar basal body rod protein FlgG